MENVFKVFFIVIVLLSSLVATADPSPAKQNLSKLHPTALKAMDNELIIAKAELAASHRFQEQVLSTVYWSLGTIAGLAILLVGYGWWTNFRIYDRDKESLEREIRVLLNQKINEMNEQFRIDFAKHNLDTLTSLANNLQTAEARINASLENSINTHKKEVATKLSQLKTEQKEIQNKIHQIELTNKIKDREEYVINKSYRNALQDSVTALEIALKLSYEYEVGEVLDLVTEDINNCIANERGPIDNFLISQLVSVLDKVEGSHAHAAAGLKSKIPELISTKK